MTREEYEKRREVKEMNGGMVKLIKKIVERKKECLLVLRGKRK